MSSRYKHGDPNNESPYHLRLVRFAAASVDYFYFGLLDLPGRKYYVHGTKNNEEKTKEVATLLEEWV
jgi:hypothetical protein